MTGQKCSKCGSTENLHTHHISYEPEETQILCASCHKKTHMELDRVERKKRVGRRPPVIEERKIIKMGHSRGVTIPSEWLESEGIGEGDKILLVGNEVLKIRPSSEEAIKELHKKIKAIE